MNKKQKSALRFLLYGALVGALRNNKFGVGYVVDESNSDSIIQSLHAAKDLGLSTDEVISAVKEIDERLKDLGMFVGVTEEALNLVKK